MEIKISAIVIAKDEELMIEDCIKSLKWVDELLIIDHGSIDKTAAISKKHDAKLIKLPRESGYNYSSPRNIGMENAKGEWILYIDADERVSEDLAVEIKNAIISNKNNFYAIPRKNIVLGKELKHGGQYPDYVKRLFKKSELSKWTGKLHEEPNIKGEIGHLNSSLTHIKHESLAEMVDKTNGWSEIEAKLMYDAKHPKMNIFRFMTGMIREFWKRMIIQMSFLDGSIGIIYAMYQVYSRFVSYAKLWELQIKNESSDL